MVVINFTVFVDKIEAGLKCQTIRKTARCKPGDTLELYTYMGTKNCRLIGTATCLHVKTITIAENYISSGFFRLPSGDQHHIATIDGFDDVESMKAFFRDKYGLPFKGKRIMWTDFKLARTQPRIAM